MEEKFSKGMENILKSRNVRNETSINQIQTTVDSIISRQDPAEERISEEDKIEEILHTITMKKNEHL
jgi:hypothetical protein